MKQSQSMGNFVGGDAELQQYWVVEDKRIAGRDANSPVRSRVRSRRSAGPETRRVQRCSSSLHRAL